MSETLKITEKPEVVEFLRLVGQAPAPADAQSLILATITIYVGKIINSGVATRMHAGEPIEEIAEIVEEHISSLFGKWSSEIKCSLPQMINDFAGRYDQETPARDAEVVEPTERDAEVVENV